MSFSLKYHIFLTKGRIIFPLSLYHKNNNLNFIRSNEVYKDSMQENKGIWYKKSMQKSLHAFFYGVKHGQQYWFS